MNKLILIWLAVASLLLPSVGFASIEVVGGLKHSKTAMPGEVYKGQIKIQNSGTTPQEVRVYQTDMMYNYEDYTLYEEPVTHNRSNANWILFSPRTTILQPQEVQYIQYEVRVPSGDSLKGTFWSILMVEGVNPIDPNQQGKLLISTVTRYAVQMITELADPGLGALKFLEPSLIHEGTDLFLAIDLLNIGEHYISPEVSVEFFDDQGTSLKKIIIPRKGLYPNTSARFRTKLEGLESNKTYKTLIIAAGKEEDVFGLEYTLYF
jgi:hypothetical protein